ncbi:MAG: hypothetical protein FD170_1746 [Bacteroidetes bacterium]|nr:MAG: hypothetical protein FD170_1746 [Bacteroidota bacterium]
MRNSIIILLSIFLLSCSTGNLQKDSKPFISIDIKDFAKLSNDTIGIDDFMISPIGSNAIWTFNTNGPSFELKLTDSSWTNLDNKFGKYSYGLKKDNIVRDTIDKELIWICNFRSGLIAYNTVNESYIEFKSVKHVSGICFLENNIVIGTLEGLYLLDRNYKAAVKSHSFEGVNVNNIKKISSSLLLINDMYEFDIDKDSIVKTREKNSNIYASKNIKDVEITTYQNNNLRIKKGDLEKKMHYPNYLIDNVIVDDEIAWIPLQNSEKAILKYNLINDSIESIPIGYGLRDYKLLNTNDLIWLYYDNEILWFNKIDYSTHQFTIEERIYNAIVDSKYLYINTWHGIEIYEKAYLFKKSIDISGFVNEEKRLNDLIDSLGIYKTFDFISSYNSYKILHTKFSNSQSKRIQFHLNDIKESLKWRLPKNFEEIKSLEKYVLDSINDTEIIALFYLQAIRVANHNGKLKESLGFDSILNHSYPDFITDYHNNQMREVAKSYKSITSINSSSLPPDEKLWLSGKAYYDLFLHVGSETEVSSIDMTFPFLFFESLLKKYPKSKYADDAEFLILSHIEGGSHEGGDNSFNLTAIEKYKSIIKKYPDTEFTPEIYHKISELYYSCDSAYVDNLKYYKIAMKYADKIIVNYPSYKKVKVVVGLKEEIERSISEILLD